MRVNSLGFRLKLITVILLILFGCLGVWQLYRAEFKRQLQFNLEQAAQKPTLTGHDLNDQPQVFLRFRYQDIQLRGEFIASPIILLDNQIFQRQPGYLVLSLFRVLNEIPEVSGETQQKKICHILINRGWIPRGKSRQQTPEISLPPLGTITLTGILNLPPSPWTLSFGKSEMQIESQPFHEKIVSDLSTPATSETSGSISSETSLIRVQKINFAELSNYFGISLYPLWVELPPKHPNGFQLTAPKQPALAVEKHLGYALQWFTMGGITCVYYWLIKRRRDI